MLVTNYGSANGGMIAESIFQPPKPSMTAPAVQRPTGVRSGMTSKGRQAHDRVAWRTMGGDFRNTGRGGARMLRGWIRWVFGSRGPAAAGAAVSTAGDIYFNVFAIHPDGTVAWKASADPSEFCAQPIIGLNKTVYFAGKESLFAFSMKGHRRWKIRLSLPGWGPSIGNDGTLYFTSTTGTLLAVSPGGHLKWSKNFGGIWKSLPAIGIDGNLYFGSDDHRIYCVTPHGRVLWTYLTRWKCGGPITIGDDGSVYAPSGDGQLYVLSRLGKLLWKFNPGEGSLFRGGSLARDGTYYLVGNGGNLYCLSVDGHLRWKLYTNEGFPPAIGADGIVYAASYQAVAITPGGKILWSVKLEGEGGAPAFGSDGRLFIPLSTGQLCCIE